LPVQRGCRHLLREARLEPCVATDVAGLLTHLLGAAGDDVADLARIDVGAADQLLIGVGEEVGGMEVPVVALVGVAAADRRPHRLDDHRVAGILSAQLVPS
jgi:hypothetical protein